jgi:ankyrin repeat protein
MKETPLHMAVSGKSSRIVQLLLEHGANISITNRLKQTPLHNAMGGSMGSSGTHGSIYKLLLTSRTASKAFKTEAKYDRISSNLQSLLHSAAALGDHNMCRELIEVWRYSIE